MNRLRKYLLLLLTAMMLFGSSSTVWAEEFASFEPEDEEVQACTEDDCDEVDVSDVELDEATLRSAYLVLQLQSRISQKTAEYNQIQAQVDSAKDELLQVRESIDSLEDQIDQIDDMIAESKRKIESVTAQISEGEMEMVDLMEDIEMRTLQIEDQKRVIAELIQVLYVKQNVYYEDDNDLSTLKLLLADGSVTDVMQDMIYLDLIEETGEDLLVALKENQEALAIRQVEVEEKTGQLKSLETELWGENQNLLAEKAGKESLLAETEGKESIYQELLILSKKNQEEVEQEIDDLRANIELLDSKIVKATEELTEEEREKVLQIKAETLVDNGVVGTAEFLQLDWPIEPNSKGLSAYFDDPGYVSAFGVAHHAIDIPAIHGSDIYAPADGVVYKVKYDEESIDYAYVMIAHRKGVITVLGHVSAVAVEEGDYVSRGDVIGLSGGTPGSIGAGLRTTGAHLHFEVWQDGIVVDPLDYLDLSHIPIDTLRDDYLERLQEEIEEEISEIQASLDVLQNK